MNHDFHFSIGKAHLTSGKPCQDYALSGETGNVVYAIVNDGCSSGDKTDVGARIIGLVTAKAIQRLTTQGMYTGELNVPQLVTLAQELALSQQLSMLGLTTRDMLATCVYCCLNQEHGFFSVNGDGVIAWQDADSNIISMIRYEWADNRPFYPVYRLEDIPRFIQNHGGDLARARVTAEYWEYYPEFGMREVHDAEEISLEHGIKGITVPIPQVAALRYAAVFSDGVTQVDGIDWKRAVVELLSFKATAGDFAKRRMNRFLKEAEQYGKGPVDDIAYSVIHVNQQEQ